MRVAAAMQALLHPEKRPSSLAEFTRLRLAGAAGNGAPEGNPTDLPKALVFADSSAWQLGTPDLIVSAPTVYIGSVASDWGGSSGKTPLGRLRGR